MFHKPNTYKRHHWKVVLCSFVVTNLKYWKYPQFVKMKPTVIQIVGIEIARKKLQNTNFQNDAYCGYWKYQQIAIKKLQNFTCQSCFLWVLNLWQQKRNTKWSTNCSTNVSNLQSEVAKWSGVRPALSWRFFSLCKSQK